jgi:hypothetical protein
LIRLSKIDLDFDIASGLFQSFGDNFSQYSNFKPLFNHGKNSPNFTNNYTNKYTKEEMDRAVGTKIVYNKVLQPFLNCVRELAFLR